MILEGIEDHNHRPSFKAMRITKGFLSRQPLPVLNEPEGPNDPDGSNEPAVINEPDGSGTEPEPSSSHSLTLSEDALAREKVILFPITKFYSIKIFVNQFS